MWDCLMLDCSQSGKNSFIFLAFSNRSDAKLYIYVTLKYADFESKGGVY